MKLQLSLFISLIQVSLAVWQRMTVMKGQTVSLRCPLTRDHKTNVDWKNPQGHVMYFNNIRGEGENNQRYSLTKLSQSEFTVSISKVNFNDGGIYTCSEYGRHAVERKVEVTVLSRPTVTVTKHDGEFYITCTAEANHYLPQISWKFDNGPEILPHVQTLHEDKKYLSTDTIRLNSVEDRVTVKCLVRHPALHSQPLMRFIKIGRDTTKPRRSTARPQGSTEMYRTTTGWVRHETTTTHLATRDTNGPSATVSPDQLFSSNEPKTVTAPTGSSLSSVPSTDSHLSTSSVARRENETNSNATGTTGWTSVSETTEESTSFNRTEGNTTGSFNDPKMHTGSAGSSSLLVFLVTCLIFCLLVVVIFFAIKLRRAHMTWKRENEDSDPSEDSSKSKSSQEDKNSQGQRRRGHTNTAFTQYVAEEQTGITSVINTTAVAPTETGNREQTSQPQTPAHTSANCHIKETEL